MWPPESGGEIWRNAIHLYMLRVCVCVCARDHLQWAMKASKRYWWFSLQQWSAMYSNTPVDLLLLPLPFIGAARTDGVGISSCCRPRVFSPSQGLHKLDTSSCTSTAMVWIWACAKVSAMCCDGSSECMCALTNSCALVVNGSVNQRAVLNMGHHEINTSTTHIVIDSQESQRTSRLQGSFKYAAACSNSSEEKQKVTAKSIPQNKKHLQGWQLNILVMACTMEHPLLSRSRCPGRGYTIHPWAFNHGSWSLKPINERVFDVFDVHCSTYLTCDRGRTMQGGFEENDAWMVSCLLDTACWMLTTAECCLVAIRAKMQALNWIDTCV